MNPAGPESQSPLPANAGLGLGHLAVWQNHPFLRGLNPSQLAMLAECAMTTNCAAGQRIFREGETANRFYLLLAGRVQVEAEAPDRPAVPVEIVTAGDVLGWSWLFPPYTWNFTARALTPVRAIFFYGTWLRERCEGDAELGYELMRRTAVVLMRRLQATRQQLFHAHR
jgi:CRP/FNR family transcriptional regulator, cyclic AMP receptor protein